MEKLLNKKEAAAYLNVSQRTLDYFRQRGNLPCHIIGGKLVRFRVDELEQWATGRTSNPNSTKEDGK